jgi:hypothetical protein
MDNKKIVISFDEGCSGNFLAALLTNSRILKFDRIDKHIENKLFYRRMYFLNKDYADFDHYNIIITHCSDSAIIQKLSPNIIIRILPITGIFTAIYNVFSKKHISDLGNNIMLYWPSNPAYCYDLTMQHLKDYYNKFSALTYSSDQMIFDFGWIYDTEKLLHFANQFNINVDNSLITQYQKHQLPMLLDLPVSNNMKDIISPISDEYFIQSPWFACYSIFCYEKINSLNESQRCWSIDQLPLMNKKSLVELSYQYQHH